MRTSSRRAEIHLQTDAEYMAAKRQLQYQFCTCPAGAIHTWGSWTPHKVKLAVSGCPRNCAEATCKDLGVICVDSGYQVSVAGAAGMELKETEALATVASEQEVIDLAVAFIQLYRESANYLDRPYKWVAKVGMDWVINQVVEDADNRAVLCERFEISQSVYRKDPWAEQAKPEYRPRKWAALADLTLEAAE